MHKGFEHVIAWFLESAGDAIYIRNLLQQLLVQLAQPEIEVIANLTDQAGSFLVPLGLGGGEMAGRKCHFERKTYLFLLSFNASPKRLIRRGGGSGRRFGRR